jgi:hypothetical protein
MKPKSFKTILALALLAPGALFAQTTATTTPVGYEEIDLATGFNYMGLRLHSTPVIAGTFETVNNTTLADTGVDIAAALATGKTYIVEITDTAGVGAVAEIVKADVTTDTISTANGFAALGVTAGAKYLIREAATLASTFGATNTFGLTPGYSGPGDADLVYVPDGAGGFTQYFYDEDETSWKNAETNTAVDATSVPLVYLDGIIVFANAAETIVVSGEIKKEAAYQLVKPGFNYLSSLFPVDATLASAFNGSLASINPGYSGPGDADLIYVVNGATINQYFYDEDETTWKNAETNTAIVPEDIDLPSGIIYFNAGASDSSLKNSAPTGYSSL